MYIRQGGILLLSLFFKFDLHPFVGFCQVFESWLDLLAWRHWLNSSFINFKIGYIHLVHLLVVLLQVFNVPWPRESLSVYGF